MKTHTAEAPGRLDFMGGVADYSGSLVLEMPLSLTTRVKISEFPPKRISRACEGAAPFSFVFVSETYGEERVELGTPPSEVPQWARYPYGCLWLFAKEQRIRLDKLAVDGCGGLRFEVSSRVPEAMGVSSSAALEVATLRALELFFDKPLKGQTTLARLAQRVENEIVGAPCGLMDQLASANGVKGALLPILCRPDILGEPVKLPKGIVAVGWPSGVKHAVSDSPYATARAAAFMGKKLIEATLGRRLKHATELAPSVVRSLSLEALPERMSGRAFLEKCGGVDDPLSTIEPGREYAPRAGVSFPVEESFRSEAAVALLRGLGARNRAESLAALGELLYQSHAGYSSIGLGCPETDEMVEGVRALGPKRGLYGARVSGGGSGGTVVVLLEQAALPALTRLAKKLGRPTTFVS
ncbi:hypothetical protein AXK12_00775 [Cephaloticoccus capnophilus]|uniref:GHMP kinase n=1 Tax=Cephaloticoccus capnophilus TaxID=1548208 RepID=A0A139STZ8_9BACT|nr:hypothetical protein [Cephaloticoccus capnophilus]KXU38069.1 hypothetical protein AXK12_00775 [Cephaloticoccus capnophilus]